MQSIQNLLKRIELNDECIRIAAMLGNAKLALDLLNTTTLSGTKIAPTEQMVECCACAS